MSLPVYPHTIGRDIVSDALRRGEPWEDHVYQALEPYLDPEADAVDIGANVGAMALRFAQKARRVICFEPSAEMCVALLDNATANGLGNLEIIPQGAYSRVVRLQPNVTGYPPSSWAWLPADTGIAAEPARWSDMDHRVSVIKSDCQGADLHALIGMARIIDRDHPAIVFEWEKELAYLHGHEWRDYVTWLVRHGYKIKQLEPSGDYLALPI